MENNFIQKEFVKQQKVGFLVNITFIIIGYILMTLFLNSIRATASLWIVWPLIIFQFILYCLIFSTSLTYYQKCGLKFGLPVFLILAILGRIENWELVIIPLTILGVSIISLFYQGKVLKK